VTDAGGVVVVMYEYRAFGEQLKRLDAAGGEVGDEAKYSYGGKELDGGTNLYYFNARYYDATIGRFINVDPVQDGSNWYVYVNNNPLCFMDPTGLEEENTLSDEILAEIPDPIPTINPDDEAYGPDPTPRPDDIPQPQSNAIEKEYNEWEQRYKAVTSGNLEEIRHLFNEKDDALLFINNLQRDMNHSLNEMHSIRNTAATVEDIASLGSITTGVISVTTAKIIAVSAATKVSSVGLVCSGIAFVTSKCVVDFMDGAIKNSERIINDLDWIQEIVTREY
jgi:RHS repeat-associated protein